MPFEITRDTVLSRHSGFHEAIVELSSKEFQNVQVAYNIGRIKTLIQQATKAAVHDYNKLIESYTKIKEDGTWEIPDEKKESWEKEVTDFMATPIKVNRHKVRLEDLKDVSITPNCLAALEPLVDEPNGATN